MEEEFEAKIIQLVIDKLVRDVVDSMVMFLDNKRLPN